jgi:dimethylargininase
MTESKLIALTRAVSANINQCELTFIDRSEIHVERAKRQHGDYCQALSRMGVEVHILTDAEHLPDGVFVEDPAVVVDELAIITRMGSESRQNEVESFSQILDRYRKLKKIQAPGTLEGGDVLRIGKTLYVGLSKRTNRDGAEQLASILQPFGYTVKLSEAKGCLHFKTGCSYLGENTLLINPSWVDRSAFDGLKLIHVDLEEPFAANSLEIGGKVLYSKSFPKTLARLEKAGFTVELIDISELMKAEAGLTCMSQIFRAT